MFSFMRKRPEEVGIPSGAIAAYIRAIEERRLCLHSLLIIRRGALVFEGQWAPMTSTEKHRLYSSSKSFVSMAIGLLVGDGKLQLSDRVVDFFPEYDQSGMHRWMKDTTIRDLLCMADCHDDTTYNMNKPEPDMDWVRTWFETPPTHKSGTVFQYNTACTLMLCVIVERVAGKNFEDLLRERVFEPMGMREDITCVKSPCGHSWGGSGILAGAMDLAKMAYLVMHGGCVDGKQLLPADYVREATANQIDNAIDADNVEYMEGYGYQIWMSDDDGDYQFNGAFGQYVLVFPKQETVIAMYSGSSNLFVNGGLSGMVRELLTSFADEPLAADNEAYASLKSTLNSLEYSPSHPRYLGTDAEEFERIAYRLDGREYFAGPNTGGLFPQTLQAVHSNMTDSVTMLRFEKRDKDLYLYIYEKDERNLLVLRHDGAFEYGAATMRGERQLVATRCRWKLDVNRIRLWVMTGFIETPNSRILTLDIAPQKMSVTFDERPALDKTVQMLFDLVGVSSMAFYRHMLPLLQRENLVNLVKRFTEPVAECVMVKHNDEEPLPRIEK